MGNAVEAVPLGNIANATSASEAANRTVLWGWKRDVGSLFRVVYFSGQIEIDDDRVSLGHRYFFYRHRLPSGEATRLYDIFAGSDALRRWNCTLSMTEARRGDLADLVVTLGTPSEADVDKTTRLQRRRPRHRIGDPAHVIPATIWSIADIFPADVYVGSGLSYEAGLPTLCHVHDVFGVDRSDKLDFTVGEADPLPARLAADPIAVLRQFCEVHTKAISAKPTPAMRAIKTLHERRLIGKVFTDNVDNLLAKVDVPYERTRGSGVFNERYPATFTHRNLIVIGVAADRRMLVSQARAQRGRIIIVNPCTSVAPKVRHLDYLRAGDLFLKMPAHEFFERVKNQLGQPAERPAAYGSLH